MITQSFIWTRGSWSTSRCCEHICMFGQKQLCVSVVYCYGKNRFHGSLCLCVCLAISHSIGTHTFAIYILRWAWNPCVYQSGVVAAVIIVCRHHLSHNGSFAFTKSPKCHARAVEKNIYAVASCSFNCEVVVFLRCSGGGCGC